MAVIGNPDPWAKMFPHGLIPDIISLVSEVWTKFGPPLTDELEVPLTIRFVKALKTEKNSLRQLPVRIVREFHEDEAQVDELGRIDIVFFNSSSHREEVYFAFECKRLNVTTNGKFYSLANLYVNKGLVRYTDGLYSSELNAGGMIGYVFDGNIDSAVAAVDAYIKNHDIKLNLRTSGLEDSSHFPTLKHVKESNHSLARGVFTVHHLFLCG